MKKKINLKELKIKSFVVTLDNDSQAEVKGGRKYERSKRVDFAIEKDVALHVWTVSEIR